MSLFSNLLPPATKLGQGYVFTGVCDSVHGGGEYLTRYTPPGPGPPGPGTPPLDQVHPQTRCIPLDQVHPRDHVHPPDQVHPPWDQGPPRPGTPPGNRYTPPAQSMLGDTVNARAVRILLECILVFIMHCQSHFLLQKNCVSKATQADPSTKTIVSPTPHLGNPLGHWLCTKMYT